jgi:hypothetical protein
MSEVLKFSLAKPTTQQIRRIVRSQPRGYSRELHQAAYDRVQEEERRLRFSEPRLAFMEKYLRLSELFPDEFDVLNSRLGPNGIAPCEPEDVADQYVVAEEG